MIGNVYVKIFPESEEFIPKKAHADDAGFDIRACISDAVTINPGERKLISAGFKVAIPPGWELQIVPRSGLALKQGITLTNSPGTIDAGYRGPVGIILHNTGSELFVVEPGERIAQCMVREIVPVLFVPVESDEELSMSVRGPRGFGSTGAR